MITLRLKDGKELKFEPGLSVLEIAGKISEGLARNALAALIDGELADLRTVVNRDCALEILTFDDDGGKWTLRHTAAHVLAQAVLNLYPGTQLAIGPAIDNGFYYDFDFIKPLTAEELPRIEEEMKRLVKTGMKPKRFATSRQEALEREKNNPYKTELITELPDNEEISFYEQDGFVDLCAGPHVVDTKVVKAIKLTSVAGAYWRGNEKNKMLTRIYGTAYTKQADLDAYLTMLEEAKKRDHRRLGRELELFTLLDEGQGFPFFLPNGLILKNLLMDYWREVHRRAGYKEIQSPLMLSRGLWEVSGHADNYADKMYTTKIDEREFSLKPMNCPGGILVYKQDLHSYREFPLRLGEMGIVHRHELSGTLHGLMRVRSFTQDDAHIYMTEDQIKDEVKHIVGMIDEMYATFGFEYLIELSTRPEKSIGTAEIWDMSTESLREALVDIGKPFKINEGDGAFYGPKIDFHLLDAIGRTWQCATIQLDFNLPERFDLEYVAADGTRKPPVMIHRVIYGALERFMGILIEHYAGAFPLWLSPVQAIVLPISDKVLDYAISVEKRLDGAGFRAQTDRRQEKIGFKIRDARNRRIPYILVVGDAEAEAGNVALRSRAGDEGAARIDAVIERMRSEVDTRSGN